MLSIEYTHKRAKLFRLELSLLMVSVLAVIILFWQVLSILKIVK
ncbi:hypothetical protein [Polynucleobacter sp. MWH-Berg-3C6]|nr:hypothetical protein [Polynucleobacter sp. MWH-Berg-3C6]